MAAPREEQIELRPRTWTQFRMLVGRLYSVEESPHELRGNWTVGKASRIIRVADILDARRAG